MLEKLELTQRELEHLLDWAKLISLGYVYTKADSNLAVKLKMMLDECYKNNYRKQRLNIKKKL